MDIFSFLTLFGGLAFFLYGMNVMSSGLEKLAGGKLEVILQKITSNKWKSLLFGVGHHRRRAVFLSGYGHVGWFGQFRHYAAWTNHWHSHGL